MASGSVPAASAAASSVTANPAAAGAGAGAPSQSGPRAGAVSFRLGPRPKLRLLSSKACALGFGAQRSSAVVAKSQLTQVVGVPANDAVAIDQKPEVPNGNGEAPSVKEAAATPLSEETISEFMNQVASLVKLVDSRDIVELQLKQQGCEVVIRKKEALPQPPAPAPIVVAQHHMPAPVVQPQFAPPQAATPASAPGGPGASPPPSPATAAKSAKSSLPPLKSPMAGTFYRCSGPGQGPFVKVGDKVNKGQVLCIIEAMKLMNEIEADQAGTIVEILVDDTKPVSIDQPLFLIEP